MMKKIAVVLCWLMAAGAVAQAPQLVNYQGVLRSPNGSPKTATFSVQFEILQGSSSGSAIFTEAQNGLTSNGFGLFSTQIGKNSSLSAVNWNNGPFFLRIGIDTLNGNAYATLGTPQQLVSVPYALHAISSQSALSAPAPTVGFNTSNGVLSVGGNTVTLSSGSNTMGTITGSTNVNVTSDINSNYTITVNPTLSINGNSLSISGGNTVQLPQSTTNVDIAGSGAVTVNTVVAGSSYVVNTPSVTVNGGTWPFPPGILQVTGSFPNYSLMVLPNIVYSQTTGSLTLSNFGGTSPAYSYSFYATPDLTFNGQLLRSGPSTNTLDLSIYTPWRKGVGAGVNTVTLATSGPTQSVGINLPNPSAELEVNGFTKLGSGVNVPAVKMHKIAGSTAAGQGGTSAISLSGLSQPNILSVTVLVESGTNGTGNWIHPEYTAQSGYQYSWRLNAGNIEIINSAANSANILNKSVKVLITYE